MKTYRWHRRARLGWVAPALLAVSSLFMHAKLASSGFEYAWIASTVFGIPAGVIAVWMLLQGRKNAIVLEGDRVRFESWNRAPVTVPIAEIRLVLVFNPLSPWYSIRYGDRGCYLLTPDFESHREVANRLRAAVEAPQPSIEGSLAESSGSR